MKSIAEALIKITHQRLIEESAERIKICLKELSSEEIWRNVHGNHNSVGNLIQHLIGNVSQYILSGLGGHEDLRERQKEFDHKSNLSGEELSRQIDQLMQEVSQVLNSLKEEDLLRVKQVQCFDMNVMDIIIHVIEHFSYHTGQIVFYTKYLKNLDTGFYSNMDL